MILHFIKLCDLKWLSQTEHRWMTYSSNDPEPTFTLPPDGAVDSFMSKAWPLCHMFSLFLVLTVVLRTVFNSRNKYWMCGFGFWLNVCVSSDCNYTCHYRCQPFIQLDCSSHCDAISEQSNYCEDTIETDTNVVREQLLERTGHP